MISTITQITLAQPDTSRLRNRSPNTVISNQNHSTKINIEKTSARKLLKVKPPGNNMASSLTFANMVLYRPELRLTRQESCIENDLRVADVVVCGGGPTMSALSIRDDIGSEELRRRARRESDGRVSARLIAIANALEGMDRASAARVAGVGPQTLRGRGYRHHAGGHGGQWNPPRPRA